MRMTNENDKLEWQIRLINEQLKMRTNGIIVNVNTFYDLILLSFLILLIHLLYETFY